MQSGEYQLTGFDLFTKFDEDMIVIEKWNRKKPVTAIYFDGEKEQYNVKRFLIEPTDKKTLFITEHEKSFLEIVTTDWIPQVQVNFAKVKGVEKEPEIINLEEFIAVKGMKAIGNRLTANKVKNIDLLEPLPYEEIVEKTTENEVDQQDEEIITESTNNDDSGTEQEQTKEKDTAPKQQTSSAHKPKPIKDISDEEASQMKLF